MNGCPHAARWTPCDVHEDIACRVCHPCDLATDVMECAQCAEVAECWHETCEACNRAEWNKAWNWDDSLGFTSPWGYIPNPAPTFSAMLAENGRLTVGALRAALAHVSDEAPVLLPSSDGDWRDLVSEVALPGEDCSGVTLFAGRSLPATDDL